MDDLPFADYHPDLRDGLTALADQFGAATVAEAAVRLADDIARYATHRQVSADS